MFNGVAVAGFKTFASKTGHFRSDDLTAQIAKLGIRRNYGSVTCDDDCGQGFKIHFFHFVILFVVSYKRLEQSAAFLENLQFLFTLDYLYFNGFDGREMAIAFHHITDLFKRVAKGLQDTDVLDILELRHGVVAVSGPSIHDFGNQKSNLLVMPQRTYGNLAQAGELPDFKLDFTHNNCALLLFARKYIH